MARNKYCGFCGYELFEKEGDLIKSSYEDGVCKKCMTRILAHEKRIRIKLIRLEIEKHKIKCKKEAL